MQIPTKPSLILLFVFVSVYVFGYFFPDYWWSTNFSAFISPIFLIVIVFTVIWCLFKLIRFNEIKHSKKYTLHLQSKSIIFLSISFTLACLIFAMVQDFYGDAYKFNSFLPQIPSVIPKGTHDKFFNFSLAPWAGEGTVLAIITYISYYFQVTYKTAFLIFDAIFGGLFVFTWLHFVSRFVTNQGWKIVLVLAGLSAPFVLVFFGHIEIYAPVFFINLLWIYVALLYIKTDKKQLIWLLVLILLISLKLHSIAVLCIPALLVIVWKHFKKSYPSWKQIGYFIIVPIFVIGAILYFFYFEDHIDDRSLQRTAMAFEHMFLPLFTPEAPLDQYNLLSFNHFFDYFQVILLWSPIALFIITLFLVLKRNEIDWEAPEILISGLCLFLFIAFFFVVNPLLGMPIDWDLFSLPAPYLLVFTVVLTSQLESSLRPQKVLYASGIIALLSIPSFLVHQSERSLSHRLESVAVRMYNTYYEWTAQTVDNAFSLDNEHNINRLERGEAFINKLTSKAQKGIDYEYSALLIDQGRYLLRVQKKPREALKLFKSAQEYSKANNAKLLSLEAYFMLNQYEEAFKISKELVKVQFPDAKKALKMNLHCALEADLYQEAFETSTIILKNWPNDETSQEVYQRLKSNDRIKELKFLFANSFRK
ncbi:tetratricopeptide repeat protein [Aquimarina sp. 2201CG5-10]|uniref:tetratricopeptide repeat protein n=1 Tax=Aquimarina callyspongiae TaxID=3098150 RepID=UPI002AB4C646|nr:tetratricopeptide repeat protein [Aquimarina sp. 2201CG5-10]MDY8135844.1 tetratricopeptide repeat protein [Aquimarina sp. 2201CG5-10]